MFRQSFFPRKEDNDGNVVERSKTDHEIKDDDQQTKLSSSISSITPSQSQASLELLTKYESKDWRRKDYFNYEKGGSKRWKTTFIATNHPIYHRFTLNYDCSEERQGVTLNIYFNTTVQIDLFQSKLPELRPWLTRYALASKILTMEECLKMFSVIDALEHTGIVEAFSAALNDIFTTIKKIQCFKGDEYYHQVKRISTAAECRDSRKIDIKSVVIFLSINGVLFNARSADENRIKKARQLQKKMQTIFNRIVPEGYACDIIVSNDEFIREAVDNLTFLIKSIEKAGKLPKIVISSCWMNGRSVDQLKEILGAHIFSQYIVGKVQIDQTNPITEYVNSNRYKEIQYYIDTKLSEEEQWIIIESTPYYIPTHFLNRLIFCDSDKNLLFHSGKLNEALDIIGLPRYELLEQQKPLKKSMGENQRREEGEDFKPLVLVFRA